MVTSVNSLSSKEALASTLAVVVVAVLLLPMMGLHIPFTSPSWSAKGKVSDSS